MTDTPPDPAARAKRAAAEHAASFVEDGMRVGLGTGSTAAWAVRRLGERVRDEGLRIRGVPTSERTAALAREAGVPLAALEAVERLDLTIDGADEVAPDLDLIKGGGGALLREKIVAAASDRFVVVADASKRVERLGAFALPVEVAAFGWTATRAAVAAVLAAADVDARRIEPRMAGGAMVRTDGGNHLLDLRLGRIGAPGTLAAALVAIPGVVETGLFLGMADRLVWADADGGVQAHDAPRGRPR